MAQNNEMDEFEELILYVRTFKNAVNNKFDEHFYIIQQQHLRIEEQNRVIDELAWQIRDLRDQVRRVNTFTNNKSNDNSNDNKCVCNYENHVSVARQQRSDNKLGRFFVEPVNEMKCETIYEPIEYDSNNKIKVHHAPTPAPRTSPITKQATNLDVDRTAMTAITPNYGQVNKLKRQPKGEIFNEEELLPRWSFLDEELKRCSLNEKKYINSTGPNNNDVSQDDDQIDEFVILRNMHKKNLNFNTKRGSSKALTSLLSNIEEDYIPEANKLTDSNIVQLPHDDDNDDDDDDDDSKNILKANKYLSLLRRPTTVTGLTPTINQNQNQNQKQTNIENNNSDTTESVQIRPSFNAANKRMGISMR